MVRYESVSEKMEDMLEPFGGWRYKRAVEGNVGGIAA